MSEPILAVEDLHVWFDLAKGGKLHRVPVPHLEALGNLALHRGLLVSQSVTYIAAFPVAGR